MFTALIIFIASGALIALFFGIKVFQMRSGFLLFWPRWREGIEAKLQDKKRRAENYIATFGRKQMYVALHAVLTEFRRFIDYLREKIDRRIYKLVHLIKGKKNVDRSNRGSSYLQDIHPYSKREEEIR